MSEHQANFGTENDISKSMLSRTAKWALTGTVSMLAALLMAPAANAGLLEEVYSFSGAADGDGPVGGLYLHPNGSIYGTTSLGGVYGAGTIYKIDSNGIFSAITQFNYVKGASPVGALILGPDGQMYGTTELGGVDDFGSVYKVTPDGVLTSLASFHYDVTWPSGAPYASLCLASDGAFYGTTLNGGFQSMGDGTIFKVTPDGQLTTVQFLGSELGRIPYGGLIQGNDGYLYGTASRGGSNGFGNVFRMSLTGEYQNFAQFDSTNGVAPYGTLLLASDGNFYGTTSEEWYGGNGTVFRMTPEGVITTLARFGGTNGSVPYCGVIQGADGNFYGTTKLGGKFDRGTVFQVTPDGALTTLVSFDGTNGSSPTAPLIQTPDGRFYGTTYKGGSQGSGTVFRMTFPPRISLDPISRTVGAGASVTFTAQAIGSGPISYQWTRNGVAIPDATNAAFTIVASTANAGNYAAIASNNGGSVASQGAILKVGFPDGVYSGLFYETSGITHQRSGYFSLASANGSFSGSLLIDGDKLTFASSFTIDGQSTLTLPRKPGKTTLTCTLELYSDATGDHVRGAVDDGTWAAPLAADLTTLRNAFSPLAGNYTLAFLGTGNGSTVPGGDGVAQFKVGKDATVQLVGTLSDGTAVTASTSVAPQGRCAIYLPLYQGNGSFLGWVNLTNRASSAVEGPMSWIKARPYGSTYTNGFAMTVSTVGSTAIVATNWTTFKLTNTIVTLTGGGLAAPLTRNAVVQANRQLLLDPVIGLNLTLSTNNTVSGVFTDPTSHMLCPISGIVLYQQNIARGFFLNTKTQKTGSFLLQAK